MTVARKSVLRHAVLRPMGAWAVPMALGMTAAITLVVAGGTALMIFIWFGLFGGMSRLPIPVWFPRFWAVCWFALSVITVPLFLDLKNKRVGAVLDRVLVPALLTALTSVFLGPVSVIGVFGAIVIGCWDLRRDRYEEWQCGSCGYDMRGSPVRVCPECGNG